MTPEHVPGETPYLEGITVLDFTQYLAGPTCTRLMVEMGADVIKVEMPPHGEPTRSSPPRKNRRSAYHVQQNRGKRSLAVDMTRPEGIDLLKELVKQVDVVVENYSPGVMARRGLGYDDLREINPRIIMCSISGFGQSGPLTSKSAYDFIAQAYSGMIHMTGEPDRPPVLTGLGVADTSTGVHGFAAIGYALFRRDRTGEGAHLDIGMVDSMYHMQEVAVSSPSLDPDFTPERSGRHYGALSPAGVFQGPEAWIVVFAAENQIRGLWKALGNEDLGLDPRFDNTPHRIENRDALTEIIETWMSTFATDRAVLDALEANRVPCGPVVKPWELRDAHPHFAERGTVRTVDDPYTGPIDVPGFPLRFSDAPPLPDLLATDLGENNAEVLVGMLGYDEAAVEALEADGILFAKRRD
ncbi:MAG: CaiB/BaiF CoA transferase family protein [Acidimicrobiales bacterium]|jgi:CoA:oxalate CoA-transferase